MAAAADAFEIVLEETAGTRSWIRSVSLFVAGVFGRESAPDPGGMIISVVHKQNGSELFRHIEDMGDDDGHLLDGIQHDLASMTADEFAARWGS